MLADPIHKNQGVGIYGMSPDHYMKPGVGIYGISADQYIKLVVEFMEKERKNECSHFTIKFINILIKGQVSIIHKILYTF